jgi:putative ABC transport system permease protein
MPAMLSALDRKLLRDLARLWAQVLAVSLVLACGAATLILAIGAYRSLQDTRAAFYERYRFGHVFATLTRAPLSLGRRIEAIEGVSAVSLRIVKPVILDIEGLAEPAAGLAVSLPSDNGNGVNRLYLRSGRLPEPGRAGEVAVIESFATANGFSPGDSFSAIMNGAKRRLTISGVVLSPEYIYAIGPGDMVPDQRRFGVFFLPREALAGLYGMQGSFNDVALTLLAHADARAVMDELDALLRAHGGAGAYERADQISNAFLDAELTQLNAMAKVIPPIFLLVSAFLVHMILSRLIALEREHIGLLKAIGYSNLAVAFHYGKIVVAVVLIGLLIGSLAGSWLGRGLTRLYGDFFSFPFLVFRSSFDLYALAGIVSLTAAMGGALTTILSAANLPPAVAMLPPPPASYRRLAGIAGRLARHVPPLSMMMLRSLAGRPLRAATTALGASLSVALLLAALFSYDSIDYMIDMVFFRMERQDAVLTFATARPPGVMQEVAYLPGVIAAEPFRSVPVRLVSGHREQRIQLTGIAEGARLSRFLDEEEAFVAPLPAGILLSRRLATKLALRPGDLATAIIAEQDDREARLPVAGILESYVGLTATMRLDALDRLMRDGNRISGARIEVDPARLGDLYDAVKSTPALGSIALTGLSRQRFRETIEENITTMTVVYVVLAVIITFGVIYNSARIQLSERARELASLRVLGFTRAEVSAILLGEIAVIVLLAQPLGWLLGYALAWAVTRGFESDLYRVPLVVETSTFAWSSLVVLGAALASALVVRRRIDRLDLIRVLKTRE